MLAENKIKRFPQVYSRILNLSKDISKEDAAEVMALINPRNAMVKKISSVEEFAEEIVENTIEGIFLEGEKEENIFVVKGENLVIGAKTIFLDGSIQENISPMFSTEETCLIVKENLLEEKGKCSVIAYVPD